MNNDLNNLKEMVKFKSLNKWYGDFHALKDIDLNIEQGEIVVICGPSGSGKSTLIRCINQLEPFESGELSVLEQALPSKFSTSRSSNQKSTAFWELGDPKISW
ncbi:ABC transporter domain-containing protein [Vibrio crassostreae]|nr:hypothetical protein A9261_21915 [Vibrio tasmaniensis]CAK3908012.1 ABC transporter domain-containing protein [Vibrio crassostreae]